MENLFLNYIEQEKLLPHDSTILMAVSGGIDSMVMAHLMLSLPNRKALAHCNFSLRGKESDADELFVKEFAEKNGIPFFSVRFSTSEYAEEKKISIQMAARELRHRWFEEVRIREGLDVIALAHNLNDNTETFFINLIRGSGVRGLSGMKPASGRIIRPLLFATREEIAGYARENSIGFREDSSNSETKYVRNRLRHNILPLLRELNPSFDATVAETGSRLSEAEIIIGDKLREIRKEITFTDGETVHYDLEKVKSISSGTVLLGLFEDFGLTPSRIEELKKLFLSETGSRIITRQFTIFRDRNEIVVCKTGNQGKVFEEHNSLLSLVMDSRIIETELLERNKLEIIPDGKSSAVFDYSSISFPVIIRNWQEGDWFIPYGMKGKKKVSDFLTDIKVPASAKKKVLVLESAGKIFWVAGYRTDDRFFVGNETEKVLLLKIR